MTQLSFLCLKGGVWTKLLDMENRFQAEGGKPTRTKGARTTEMMEQEVTLEPRHPQPDEPLEGIMTPVLSPAGDPQQPAEQPCPLERCTIP